MWFAPFSMRSVQRLYTEDHLDRIMAITKVVLKTHATKWPLEFIGGKYNCAGEDQQQL
jgi:hypothetical protein